MKRVSTYLKSDVSIDILSLPSMTAAIMSMVWMVAICRQEIMNTALVWLKDTCREGILQIAAFSNRQQSKRPKRS
jgi:hypothetical protein